MADTAGRGLTLENGSRVAVVGGGPAGSFFGIFLLDMARRAGIDLQLDIYEPRDFNLPGPAGCNMCGGVVSESLVQILATEGINLPTTVVQRGIDSYVLHMKEGSVRIDTPLHEKRIAVMHRGAGPRGMKQSEWRSFDGFLQNLASERGARAVRGRVDAAGFEAGRPWIRTRDAGESVAYDLLAVAVGVNSQTSRLFEGLGIGYRQPKTARTFICEFELGEEDIETHLGSSMHVFLMNLPRVDFAALIPKGDYATLCMMGPGLDAAHVRTLLDSPRFRACMPPGWTMPSNHCHCSPSIAIRPAAHPYADRIVFVGDCGVTRLYKDGIGAAYKAAKAAAVTAVFEGISAESFRRHYGPVCRGLIRDNLYGRAMFTVAGIQQKFAHDRRGILRMLAGEHRRGGGGAMSSVMWDMFSGSAPYTDIFYRTLWPRFWGRLVLEIALGFGDRAGAEPGGDREATS